MEGVPLGHLEGVRGGRGENLGCDPVTSPQVTLELGWPFRVRTRRRAVGCRSPWGREGTVGEMV